MEITQARQLVHADMQQSYPEITEHDAVEQVVGTMRLDDICTDPETYAPGDSTPEAYRIVLETYTSEGVL